MPTSKRATFLHEGRVGLTTHYFPRRAEDVDRVTEAFDAGRVAEQVAGCGAKWFMPTLHHQPWLMMAPNATYDAILGHSRYTAERDLALDLHAALAPRGVALMIYVNLRLDPDSQCVKVDPQIPAAMGGFLSDALVANVAAVYREWSERYGDKVAGWWVDGAWMDWFRDSPKKESYFAEIAAALRAGNPGAAVAFNPGVKPERRLDRYSAENDYLAGEADDLETLPAERWFDGAQWHAWTFLGNRWGCAATRFATDELVRYGTAVAAKGGAMSFDVGTLGIVKDGEGGIAAETGHRGHIDPGQVEQVAALTAALAAE